MAAFDNLMKILKVSLNYQYYSEEELSTELNNISIEDSEWGEFADLAVRNSVAGIIYDVLQKYFEVPEYAMKRIRSFAYLVCQSNYRIIILNKQLTELFEKAGITFCIMKGMAAASDFPVPDLRKAGDIDILLTNPADLERAISEIEKLGYRKEEEQHSLHHVSLIDSSRCEIEVHTMLAEPFDNGKINGYIDRLVHECGEHIVKKEVMGTEIPVLEDAYHAYELLLHMLQHFLRAGFGIKLLCDWVVLWNRGLNRQERDRYMTLVNESGIKGFSDVITRTCIKYLGLKRDNVLWMKPFESGKARDQLEEETALFMDELMDAEEFGKAKDRMVALRGSGLFAYIREFHHQMHLNFPRAGKCFLLWPVLWIVTLVRFLRNNRKVRSVSSKELLANAGKRGKLVKKMKLFK